MNERDVAPEVQILSKGSERDAARSGRNERVATQAQWRSELGTRTEVIGRRHEWREAARGRGMGGLIRGRHF